MSLEDKRHCCCFQLRAAKPKRQWEAEQEQKQQEHVEKLKQMQIDKEEKDKNKKIKQRNDSIAACKAEIAKFDELIDTDTKQLENDKRDFEQMNKALDAKQQMNDNFATYK